MKKLLSLFLLLPLAIASCGDDKDEPTTKKDPEGVVEANIMLSSAVDVSGLDIYLQNYNFMSNVMINFDHVYLFTSVGSVKSISDINKIPNSGWSESVAAEVGKGYVIGIRETVSHGCSDNLIDYGRMYVSKAINNSSGEIIGYTIKVQYPWNPQ